MNCRILIPVPIRQTKFCIARKFLTDLFKESKISAMPGKETLGYCWRILRKVFIVLIQCSNSIRIKLTILVAQQEGSVCPDVCHEAFFSQFNTINIFVV